MKHINLLLISSFLSNFIFNSKNNSYNPINKISLKKEVVSDSKEISFYYKVNPIIFDDTILINSYYVIGSDMYYSPIEDNPISIIHDSEEQYIRVRCLKPFDRRIIIKLFSAKNSYVYTKIILDYKEKFELISSKLKLDQEKNYFYIEPTIKRSVGSIRIDSNIKYNSIKYSNIFIDETKYMMKKKAEEKIYSLTNSKDIIFNHQFSGFDNSLILSFFTPSTNKVFSCFSDQISYSYFDYSNNKTINENITYDIYDLLKYDFYYNNQILFDISYSIDTMNFNGRFGL